MWLVIDRSWLGEGFVMGKCTLIQPIRDAVVDDVRLSREGEAEVVFVGRRLPQVDVVTGDHEQGTGVTEPAGVLESLRLDLRARVQPQRDVVTGKTPSLNPIF